MFSGRNLQALNPLNLVNHHHNNHHEHNSNNLPNTPTSTGNRAPTDAASVASLTPDDNRSLGGGAGETSTVNMANRPSESSATSHQVDDLYKEFTEFQSNLKTMVGLYKNQHKLMTKLNEQRFSTANCYNEMFGNTPMSSIVSPKEQRSSSSPPPSAPFPPQELFPTSVLLPSTTTTEQEPPTASKDPLSRSQISCNKVPFESKDPPSRSQLFNQAAFDALDDGKNKSINATGPSANNYGDGANSSENPPRVETIDEMSYPDVTNLRNVKMDPEEVGIDKQKIKGGDSSKEVRYGRKKIEVDDNDDDEDDVSEVVAVDEPKRSVDPPSSMDYPHDEIDDSLNRMCNVVENVVNVLVGSDDDDDDEDENESENENYDGDSISDESNDDENTHKGLDHDEEDENASHGKSSKVADEEEAFSEKKPADKDGKSSDKKAKGISSRDEIMEFRSFDTSMEEDDEVMEARSFDEFIEEIEGKNKEVDTEPEIVLTHGIDDNMDGSVNVDAMGDKEGDAKDEKPLATINTLEKESIASPLQAVSPVSYACSVAPLESFFDVHSAAHSETSTYLEQYINLVNYLEEWENTVSSRVKARHGEYVKFRKNLYHYIKKVDTLKNDHKKLIEKNKPIKPKQEEKLERNVVKLTGARETHDSAGESLILLLDEIVHRAWKDVYPLLKMTIHFEEGYSAMQGKIFGRLSGTAELLDIVSEKESIVMTSRLEALRTMNPEVLYTGPKGRGIGLPTLDE